MEAEQLQKRYKTQHIEKQQRKLNVEESEAQIQQQHIQQRELSVEDFEESQILDEELLFEEIAISDPYMNPEIFE